MERLNEPIPWPLSTFHLEQTSQLMATWKLLCVYGELTATREIVWHINWQRFSGKNTKAVLRVIYSGTDEVPERALN